MILPDTYHRLELQSCLFCLLGVGQAFHGESPTTLADPEEHGRADDLPDELRRHHHSLEYLGLTLKSLGEKVILPSGEFELLKGLIIERLGRLTDDEPLAPRLQVVQAEAK